MSENQNDHRPYVGVATFVFKQAGPEAHLLLGKRKGSHGAGTWSLPGGHLEFAEDPAIAAIREVREETGIVLSRIARARRLPYASTYFPQVAHHYITLFFYAIIQDGQEPMLLEPDRCAEWRWFSVDQPLPEPLFGALRDFSTAGAWGPAVYDFVDEDVGERINKHATPQSAVVTKVAKEVIITDPVLDPYQVTRPPSPTVVYAAGESPVIVYGVR